MTTVQQTLCVEADVDQGLRWKIPSIQELHVFASKIRLVRSVRSWTTSSISPAQNDASSSEPNISVSSPPVPRTTAPAVLPAQLPTGTLPRGGEVLVKKPGILEKLRHLKSTSRLNLAVDHQPLLDPAKETEWNQKKKKLLNHINQNPLWFYTKGTPSFGACLVSITSSSTAEATPYICIQGFLDDKDICELHKRLSTKSVRAIYHPLRLCYDPCPVSGLATQNEAQFCMSPSDRTLCGKPLRRKLEDQVQISTIGGLVEFGDQLFVLTTAHKPADTYASESDYLQTGPFNDSDFDDDVEEALVVDYHRSPADLSLTKPAISQNLPTMDEWNDLGSPVAEGDDWQLYKADLGLCRPNRISGIPGAPYIFDVERASPSTKKVLILTSTSGVIRGTLQRNEFDMKLALNKPFMSCWMVEFEQADHLQKGDSGSWVVDPESRSVLGHIVASSNAFGYLMPMARILEDISAFFKSSDSTCLASPFNVLADLAKHHQDADFALAKNFARQALALCEVQGYRDLLRLNLTMDEFFFLAKIIMVGGKDVVQGFDHPEKWVSQYQERLSVRDLETERVIAVLGKLGLREAGPFVFCRATTPPKSLSLNSVQPESTEVITVEPELTATKSGEKPQDMERRDLKVQESRKRNMKKYFFQRRLLLLVLLSITITAASMIGAGPVAMLVVIFVDPSVESNGLVRNSLFGGMVLAFACYLNGILISVNPELDSSFKAKLNYFRYFLAVAISFLSPMLVTWALSARILQNQGPFSLSAAGAAAGAPYMMEVLTSHSLSMLLMRGKSVHYGPFLFANLFAMVLYGAGWTALAGFTFARVAANLGEFNFVVAHIWQALKADIFEPGFHICEPEAATAGAAVYGAITCTIRSIAIWVLWRFRYFITLLIYSRVLYLLGPSLCFRYLSLYKQLTSPSSLRIKKRRFKMRDSENDAN